MSLNNSKYKVKSNFSNSGVSYLEKKTLTPNEKRIAGEKTLFTRERERERRYLLHRQLLGRSTEKIWKIKTRNDSTRTTRV